jgi:hypothetical protein
MFSAGACCHYLPSRLLNRPTASRFAEHLPPPQSPSPDLIRRNGSTNLTKKSLHISVHVIALLVDRRRRNNSNISTPHIGMFATLRRIIAGLAMRMLP